MFDREKQKWRENRRQKHEKIQAAQAEALNRPEEKSELSASLAQNIKKMDKLFADVDILVSRRFQNTLESTLDFCIYFTDGLVSALQINDFIIRPLMESTRLEPGENLFDSVKQRFVVANEVKETKKISEIIEAVTYGDTVLLMETSAKALIISSKSFALRGISEPEAEKVVAGPREGFTEGLMANLSMVRRRLRTNKLKMKMRSIGRETKTGVCVCYLDGIVNPSILEELEQRLAGIDMDGVLDSNYISEYITEKSFFSLNTSGYTERPDVVAAKLLEGRIAIFVDGTPMVLTVPFLFIENFQSNEDYYINSAYATVSRILRIVSFFLTTTIPALYIAVVAYHHEIVPTALMVSITYERLNVPLPAAVECFIMLISFDVLQEAGVRMPSQVGHALSVVGALVIGQAGVEARLVAAPMIIVIAFSGITGLLVTKLTPAGRVCRYLLLVAAATFGLFGLLIGTAVFLIHLFHLKTFGVDYIWIPKRITLQTLKDSFVRVPWPKMRTRYAPLSQNTVRAAEKKIEYHGGNAD